MVIVTKNGIGVLTSNSGTVYCIHFGTIEKAVNPSILPRAMDLYYNVKGIQLPYVEASIGGLL